MLGDLLLNSVFRIQIRMDSGFCADPDPDFKNPDPSIFCFTQKVPTKFIHTVSLKIK